MIFVTVGTHEQPFNRLVEAVDNLRGSGVINEPVVIQTGFSTYQPKHCEWSKILPYPEMMKNINEARIVITHGGPASFLMPLQMGKIPIVVPRQLEFNEHVNDHQVDFTRAVSERMHNIIPVYDIDSLGNAIEHYDEITQDMQSDGVNSNNNHFNDDFEQIVNTLFSKRNA